MSPEEKLKHLEFIQATISRLASHSFTYKGWAVTVVGASLALSSDEKVHAASIAALVAIVFAFLDSYYLRQERLFRCLFAKAAAGDVPDFSMSSRIFDTEVPTTLRLLLSPSILLLYGPLVLGCVAVARKMI